MRLRSTATQASKSNSFSFFFFWAGDSAVRPVLKTPAIPRNVRRFMTYNLLAYALRIPVPKRTAPRGGRFPGAPREALRHAGLRLQPRGDRAQLQTFRSR